MARRRGDRRLRHHNQPRHPAPSRPRASIQAFFDAFFDGLDMIEPGLVPVAR